MEIMYDVKRLIRSLISVLWWWGCHVQRLHGAVLLLVLSDHSCAHSLLTSRAEMAYSSFPFERMSCWSVMPLHATSDGV